MQTERLKKAYLAIGDRTPLRCDCGTLCAAACCQSDDEGKGGVCLLPEEEQVLKGISWGEIAHEEQMDAPMLLCSAACDRNLRPFLCRIFPLCPTIGKSGKWTVRMDARARAVCPLSGNGLKGLDPDFVKGCAQAVRIIAESPDGEDFLKKWAAIEAEFRKPLF